MLNHLLHLLRRHRWLASIALLLLLDLATYAAFRKGGGASAFPHQDKVLHALAFAALSLCGCLTLICDLFPARRSLRPLFGTLNALAWLAYGLFIEWAQGQLGYRSASWSDVAADAVGILLGSILAFTALARERSREG